MQVYFQKTLLSSNIQKARILGSIFYTYINIPENMEMHLHPLWTKNKCTKQSTKVNRDGLEGKYDNSTYRFADVAV